MDVFNSAEIESFALRHRLKNWKMERNCSFQRLVGGQCGQDPRSTKVQDLVPLLTCNKDVSPPQKLSWAEDRQRRRHWGGTDSSKVFNFQFSLPTFLKWIFVPLIVLRWALGGEGVWRVAKTHNFLPFQRVFMSFLLVSTSYFGSLAHTIDFICTGSKPEFH